MRFSLFIFSVLYCRFLCLASQADELLKLDSESVPTSQPTEGFVAPTVPEEFIGGGFLDPSLFPTVSPSEMSGEGTETFEEEITEENRTAITTSSYMFFTFVFLILFAFLAYMSKK